MDEDQLQGANKLLATISRELYGEGELELRIVDPRKVKRIDLNARYMDKPVFDQLVDNLRRDQRMESVPLCHVVGTKDGEDVLECVSGNHRMEGAKESGLNRVLALVIPYKLDNSVKRAKQLSHNALVGKDDDQILLQVWQEIEAIEDQLYSGLDSELVKELESIEYSSLNPSSLRTESIALWFLPEEVEDFDELLDQATSVLSAKKIYIAPMDAYKKLFTALMAAKKLGGVLNTAVAMMYLVDIAKSRLDEIQKEQKQAEKNEEKPAESTP